MKQHTAYASYSAYDCEWYFYDSLKTARYARDLSKRVDRLEKTAPDIVDLDDVDELIEELRTLQKHLGFCGFTDFLPVVRPNKKDSVVVASFKY